MAKDFIGNTIKVGDNVVFMRKNYRNFMTGIIESISPLKVLIAHGKTNTGDTETRQFHSQVIKYTPPLDNE